MQSFKGQLAVVTGAGRGIGKAIALSLAGEGATLCLVGRNRTALESVRAMRGEGAANVVVHPADVARDSDIQELAARLRDEFGRLDVLVHSHGVYRRGSTESAPVADLDALYRVNVRGTYLLTQAVLPLLKASQGQIVFVNSSIVSRAAEEVGQFAATQHSLRALADSLRQEVNREGVRVLSIYPGRTATARQASIHALEGKTYQPERLIQPEDVAFIVVSALKVARTAEVTDIHIRPMQKPLG
jgi:NADP-dependent 3-hydroxy acid dehydrogenase YdfG